MDKAESQDNNMSMEDILSSIKGILSENEKQSPEQTVQTQAPQEKPEDKVYDLSASMIVEEHQPTPKTPTTEIKDADFSIDDLPMPSADKPEDTAELPEFKLDSPHTEIDVDSEPIFDAEEDSRHLDEISALTPKQPEDSEENSISDEALDELIHSIDENNSDEILEKELPSKEPTSVDEILSQIDNEGTIQPQEVKPEENTQTEAGAVATKEDNIEEPKSEEKAEPSAEKTEPKAEKQADVPDEIIDNFAAMFNSNNGGAGAVAPIDSGKKIGDGAQTVEDLIKAVLRESLKPSIEDALTKIDENMLAEARAAVEVEAKVWVDKNLTRVVEEVVREEVRRVMAKVGS